MKREHGLPWRFTAQDGEETFSVGDKGQTREVSSLAHEYPVQRPAFDELVVGNWLHVERMNDHDWHCVVGNVHLNFHVTAKGVRVTLVEGDLE